MYSRQRTDPPVFTAWKTTKSVSDLSSRACIIIVKYIIFMYNKKKHYIVPELRFRKGGKGLFDPKVTVSFEIDGLPCV